MPKFMLVVAVANVAMSNAAGACLGCTNFGKLSVIEALRVCMEAGKKKVIGGVVQI